MGSQQLLLIVLCMVMVGVAITVALMMFQANAIESNRSALTDDLLYYATRARDYYWRPSSLGGGNRSFAGLTLSMLSKMSSNSNGHYILESATNSEVVIRGIGNIKVGDDTTQVQVIVNELNNTFRIIN
jgi:hypothetical protein